MKPLARIEHTMGKLKRFERAPLRCERTDESNDAVVSFTYSMIPIRSVHTA